MASARAGTVSVSRLPTITVVGTSMPAMPSSRFISVMAASHPPRTEGSQPAKRSRVSTRCERSGSTPKAPRTNRWPLAERMLLVTTGEAMKADARRAACGKDRPRGSWADVATSTAARARSFMTSGRCVARDMIVMPPMECPARTASLTSWVSRTCARSCARVSIARGAVPRVLAPWPRWS